MMDIAVTNNNFECLRYDYLLYFNVYVTDLLLLPLFLIWNIREIRDNSFLVHSAIFCCYRCLGCLRLLIAIFRLEVCDVIIVSKFVYRKLVYFFYCDVSRIFLGYLIAFVVV